MQRTTTKNGAARKKAGFSLVELMVVIAVIGILATIAIPTFFNVFESSTSAKNKRNAQYIASTYAGARSAGATISGNDIATKASALVQGVYGQGIFSTTLFRLTSLDASEIAGAANYLSYDPSTNMLNYIGAPE